MRTDPDPPAGITRRRSRPPNKREEFVTEPEQQPMMYELYRRAKNQLRKQRRSQPAKPVAARSAVDAQRLIQELEIHQVELEMQNTELQEARNRMEILLEKYADLYDFAPVGYFTLNAAGSIQMVNLTGANLVGVERARLVGRSFGMLVSEAQRPAFSALLAQIFASQTKHSFDFDILIHGRPSRAVNIEAVRLLSGQECRVVVMDISERKQAEMALRLSEERLRLSQEVAHIGTFDWNIETGVNLWTPELEAMYGLPPGGFARTQAAWERLVHPDDRAAAVASVDQTLRTGETVEGEWRVIWPDGSTHWVAGRFRAFKDRSGKAVRLTGVNTDITTRKRAEEKVRVSELRYRRLFEAAHDGVLLLDPATSKITDANPFMTKLLGYPNRQLVGKELFEIGLLKDEAASREMFQKLKRKHEVRYEDLPLESKHGRHQEVEVVANLYQENGSPVIQCNIRDITVRKRAEEVLRHSEALFSDLIEQAPFGVYVVDARFRLIQVNRRAKPIFSRIHPLIGRDFSEIHHILWSKQLSDPIVKRFRHTLKTGEPYRAPEFAGRRRDTGKMEYYEWQVQRVTLPTGEHGVVAFVNDITDRKLAEAIQRRSAVLAASNRKLEAEIVRRRAVERSLKQSERHQIHLLEQSHQMQVRLRHLSRQVLQAQEGERKRISRELHDVIAQTLTGINIRLSTLHKEATLDPRRLSRSITSTQRLVKQSVDVVHEFARELRPAVLDDFGLIPALRSFVNVFSKRTGIRVRLMALPDIEQLDGDHRTVLFRVAQEALANVARHAHASRVVISVQKQPDGLCMKVKDNGTSFDAERALQAGGSKRLGLLGMRERLEMVGGSFNITSAPGRGTTIEARIPLQRKNAGGGGGRKVRRWSPLDLNSELR